MLYPKYYCDSIYDVDYEMLRAKGISAIVFDVDNTLVPFDIPKPYRTVVELIKKLRNSGFKVGLLSNNGDERVRIFNEEINAPYVYKAGKPGARGLRELLDKLGENPGCSALIGDQIFTDVICANRAGVVSILVKPVSGRDEISVKWKRGLEKIVIASYEKHCKTAKKNV